MQSLQITQPWQAPASEHMEIWSVKLCFLHLLPANALLELPQQPGGFHCRLASKAHKPSLWGGHVFGTRAFVPKGCTRSSTLGENPACAFQLPRSSP